MSTSSTARSSGSRTGARSGVLVVFARTDPDDPDSITQFLVPKSRPDCQSASRRTNSACARATRRALTFDGVRIPARYRLTDEGEG